MRVGCQTTFQFVGVNYRLEPIMGLNNKDTSERKSWKITNLMTDEWVCAGVFFRRRQNLNY